MTEPPERPPAAADRLRTALSAGRDGARRASVAIVTAAADNRGLAVLAVGAALAGASWLAHRRRNRP